MTQDPYTLTVADACRYANVSRVTLWKWIKAGYFPKPLKRGPRRLRWCQADFDSWSKGRS